MSFPVWVTNPIGRKRPLLKRRGKNTPVPWIGGDGPEKGAWSKVDPDRAQRADDHRLCIICGEALDDTVIFALMMGKPYEHVSDAYTRIVYRQGSPSPTFGHDKCILLACTFCPHLKRQAYPAMLRDGTKLTFDQLRAYVKSREKVNT